MSIDSKKIKKDIGARVKMIRRQKGLTQEELATSIGKLKPVIQRLESGTVNPSIYSLRLISGGLNIKLTELFD